MADERDVLGDVKNLLEYAKTLGMTEVAAPPLTLTLSPEGRGRNSVPSPLREGGENSFPSPLGGEGQGEGKVPPSDKAAALEELRAQHLHGCRACRLAEGRANIVFGVGNPNAKLMFIGEGPGADEDAQGIPFVGRAGQLLTKIIEAMGLKRDDVYIANIVKCLRYNAMVQLGDGRWERIGRLVRQQYDGTVKSIDRAGHIVKRRVVGWHATALGNRFLYSLTYASAKMSGRNQIAIQLTGDHPVLTQRGYVAVEDLKATDRIATGQGMSSTAKQIVMGLLLGDGHIAAHQSYLSFSHSQKQDAYALFLTKVLSNDFPWKAKRHQVSAGHEKRHAVITCSTNAHRSLRLLRNQFYKGRKKVVPRFLETDLTPLSLSIWFLDDGSMRIRPGRKPLAEIATCSFSSRDIGILLKGLRNIGIEGYRRRDRIYFDAAASKELSRVIAPYIPESMRYKLHPDVAADIPFQPERFICGAPEVLFDAVVAKRINHRGTDKTFYCLDVEETNNFVTTGGVVHNCRPPNNRNPLPEEVASCLPYLIRQVEIIGPEVVVCLGSVAVQNLLGTEEKISQLRGRFTSWRGIPVMPTYHPAFLLRNPNMKKPVWEDMQQVMKRLGLRQANSV